MTQMLICVDDRTWRWPHNLVRNGVYTELERYRHCARAKEFVRIVEGRVSAPVQRYKCKACGSDHKMTKVLGHDWFWAGRFRPMLPPEQLGISTKEVRELYKPSKIKEKA